MHDTTPVQFPGNDRELILDQLFDVRDDSGWEFIPGEGCTNLVPGRGYARTYSWLSAGNGSSLVWRKELDADVVGIDRLRVRAQVAETDRLSFRAEIDGEWIDVVRDANGNDDFGEYTGPIDGRRLSAIEVVFSASGSGPRISSIMWIMAIKPGAPSRLTIPDPTWHGLMETTSGTGAAPMLATMFDSAELDQIRVQVRSDELRPLWSALLDGVEEFAKIEPEESAHPIVPYYRNRYGRPDAFELSPVDDVSKMAFAGLVEQRDDLRRKALRWALTWSRCERWVQYGIEHLPGTAMSHGRFAQAYITIAVSQVLDWCGELLTQDGRSELARAIHDLGISDIDGIMQPGSYVWTMNQGIVYECGRFHGALAIRRWYPEEYERRLEDARTMTETCLTSAILPDGTGTEGSGYWDYTMSMAVGLIDAVARASGVSISRVTPANIRASGRWAYANRRTDTRELRFIPHADSAYERGICPLVAAFFAGPMEQKEWIPEAAKRMFVSERLTWKHIADPIVFLSVYLRYLRGIDFSREVEVPSRPSLTVYRDSGQVDIKPRPGEEGIRIYFLSGPRTGHCHDDKNSFILEAYGRTLLLDRATPAYTHPSMEVSIRTEAHNTITPDGVSQTVEPGSGGATLLRAEEIDNRIYIESDAAGCWPNLGISVVRRLELYRPTTLVIEDKARWSREVSTWQCWQAPAEWHRAEEGWTMTVDDVELNLTTSSDADLEFETGIFSCDGLLRPVYRLVLRTPSQSRSLIRTVINVRKTDLT